MRQRWPEIEAALKIENEIVITRRSKPVAKLVRIEGPKAERKRWDPGEHKRWMKRVWGNKMFPNSVENLAEARSDRKFD